MSATLPPEDATTTPVAAEPIPSLAEGSSFAARLNRATYSHDIRNSLQGSFERLQSAYAEARSQEGRAVPRLLDLAERLDAPFDYGGAYPTSLPLNPVLVYTLAYAEGVQDLAEQRQSAALRAYGKEQEAYDRVLGDLIPDQLRKWLAWSEANKGYDNGSHPTALPDWDVFASRLAGRSKTPLRGVTTGLPSLDRALLGLHGLTIVAGPTGAGKSALALWVVAAALAAHRDLAALYILLDPGMTRERLYERLLCRAAGLDARALYSTPSEATRQAWGEAEQHLRANVLPRLKVLDLTAPREEEKPIDAEFIARHRNDLEKASGTDRVLVVIDYLSYLDVPRKVSPTSLDADVHRISIIQQARAYSRWHRHPFGDPYLVIAEVTKASKGDGPLGPEHLLGSSRLQYSPDTILMLEPGPQTAEPGASSVPVTLRIVKGRDGTMHTNIPLIFDHPRGMFREQALGSSEPGRAKQPSRSAVPDPLAGLEG